MLLNPAPMLASFHALSQHSSFHAPHGLRLKSLYPVEHHT